MNCLNPELLYPMPERGITIGAVFETFYVNQTAAGEFSQFGKHGRPQIQ